MIDGMRGRRGKARPLENSVVAIVEEPFLAGFEMAYDRCPALGIGGCVARRGRYLRLGALSILPKNHNRHL